MRAARLGQGTARLNRSSLVMTEAHCSGGGSVSVHGQGGGSDGWLSALAMLVWQGRG